MLVFSRRPCAALAPWVQRLWATHQQAPQLAFPHRERVLPTGAMHVVLRCWDSPPLKLFENAAGEPSPAGHLIVGGARSSYYVKQAGDGVCSVGMQLQPGAASALLGVSSSELAERHTALDALWGPDAVRLREQLYDLQPRELTKAHPTLGGETWMRAQLDLFELFLLGRVRQANVDEQQRRWLASTIRALELGAPLAAIAEGSCISHRTLITRFRSLVGLPPKVFARIRRFQHVVELLNQTSQANGRKARASLAQLAIDAGYADQAHLSRDFVEFAGVSPSAYSRLAPTAPNHVQMR